MSKTIDERVVEMRFDNKDFESNVKQSMSTLDKLKQALKFPSSSSKSSMSAVASSVKTASSNMNGLNSAVSTVRASFSALDVVAVTALGNITNGVVNATKNLVKSFTIDPITSGLHEYELQMNSIQTILANTKSKGTTIDDVTKSLDELNEYADLTIYNFAEMTKNIGTFTAAGVDLDTSVGAIKGIANLGAMSSSTATQVNTAMYQLSQALATGRVSLMDWNSVVNAGMGGEQFQNALKRTAENMGKDVDGLIKKYGSFRESLTSGGWLTADVLKETLNQIGGAYDEAELRAKGYSEENIKAIMDLADTATNAATEVKTFTQLMDTLHEAAGSGWAKTWQLIFGDFYESKDFFSGLHKMLEPVVTGPIDAMNSVIEKAMGGGGENRWGEFETKLKNAGTSAKEFQTELAKVYKASGKGSLNDLIKDYGSLEKAMASGKITSEEVTKALSQLSTEAEKSSKTINDSGKSLSEWQSIVDDVWRGDYGNIDTGRIEKLTKAGWEYADVQKLVNMTVDGHKLTLEDLTEAQIVSMGYTKEQAKALKELADEASATGKPMNELINDILTPKKSGRELFLEGLENILTAILTPLKAVGKAFNDVFGVDAKGLYSIIEGFNKFSKSLILSEDNAKRLEAVMRGVFSVFHLLASLVGTGVTAAFSAVNFVLDLFGEDFMKIAAFIGNAVYAVEQWLTVGGALSSFFERISSVVSMALTPLKEFWDSLMPQGMASEITNPIQLIITAYESFMSYIDSFAGLDPGEFFEKLANDIKTAYETIKANLTWESILEKFTEFQETFGEIFKNLVEKVKEIGPDIITGLLNGLSEGAGQARTKMQEIGNAIISAICSVLGIHSPSTVMYEIGRNIVQGLINGIQSLYDGVVDAFSTLGVDIQSVLQNIDWGAVMVAGFGLGAFTVLYKFTDALQMFGTAAKNLTAPAAGAGKLMTSVSEAIDTFTGKLTGGTKLQTAAVAIRTIAQSIAILVAAVVSLTVIDQSKLIGAVGTIAALAAIIGILAIALNKWGNNGTALEAVQLQTLLLSLAGSFALMAVAAKVISGVSWKGLRKAGAGLLAFGLIIAGLVGVSKYAGNEIDKIPSLMIKLSAAFLIMAAATKIIGGMEWSELGKAGAALLAFGAVIAALIAITKFGEGSVKGAAKFLTQIGVAFLMLAAVAKIIGGMETSEMIKAGVGLLALTGIVAALVALTNFAGRGKLKQAGSMIASIGVAMLMLTAVAKIIASMSWEEMGRAGVGLLGLVGVVAALVAITNLAPKEQIAKISATLLAMSVSIGILAGIAVLLGYVNPEKLKQGLVAIGILGLIIAAMTQATRGASNVKGSFIGIAIAIGVLAASLAVLSMIDAERLIGPAVALGSLMIILSFVLRSAGRLKKVKAGPIIALTLMLSLLSAALYILAGMPIESVLGSAIALGGLLIALAASLKLMSGIQSISGKALGAMVVLTLVMAGLAAILGLMAYLNVEASYNNAIALSGMLIIMAATCRILSGIQDVAPSAMGAMVVLTAVVAGLAVILGLMAHFEVEASMNNVAALSAMLLVMSGVCYILSGIQEVSGSALTAMVVLTAVVAGLAVILGVMAALNLEASTNNAVALSTLLISMAAACKILGTSQSVSPQAMAAMGILTAIVAGLAVILGVLSYLNVEPSIETAASLSILLVSMSAAVAILGAIGPLAASAVAGAAGLVGVVGVLTAAIAAFGAIKQIPGAEWLVSEGASFLQQIGSAIGGFIGSIAGGFLEGATSSLPQVAQQLSQFMVQLTPFLMGAKMITPEMGTSIQNLATALLALTAGSLLNSITSFLTGGGNLADFAAQLKPFGEAMADFGNAVKDVDPATMSASAEAAKALVEVANAIPKDGGLFDGIFGADQDMGEFGEQLVAFGKCLADYSAAVDGNINAEAISASAEAAKALVEVANQLPKEGGLSAAIFGEGTDMDEFGTQLTAFGNSLVSYADIVGGLESDNISNSLPAVQALIEVAKKVAELKTGGWLDTITGGEMDLAAFGEKLSAFGSSLNDYNNSLTNIEDLGKLTEANNIIGVMINMAKRLADDFPMEGFDNITKLKNLGTALKNYNAEISEIDMSTVNASANAINSLLGLVTRVSQFEDGGGISAFAKAVDQLASVNVQGIVDAFSGLSTEMVAAGANLVSWLANGMQQGTSSVIPSATQNVVQAILTTFSGQIQAFTFSGLQIAAAVALGLLNGGALVRASARSVASSALSTFSQSAGLFRSIGLNMSLGLASGISAGRSAVISAATQVASSAIAAAKSRLQIASPSKVFKKLGGYTGEGFLIGLESYADPVYKESHSMGAKAVEGMRSAVAGIGEVINSDMDFNPTISPVLDLDNVRSGAATLNNLFTDPGLEMSGVLSATGRLFDARIQNGSFDDVVKAVDRVRGKLGDLERPSYTVNGVTYDDGSNVASAVDSLTRAIRIERRV